jgi:predicted Fe-S protein YdhL (DUF1289 family)
MRTESTATSPPPERPRDAEHVRALELARWRAMSATEKVAVIHALHAQAWSLTRAGVRARHPDWTDEAVEAAVREAFLARQA